MKIKNIVFMAAVATISLAAPVRDWLFEQKKN